MSKNLLDCTFLVLAIVVCIANVEGLAMTIGADDLQDYLFCLLIATAAGLVVFVFWHMAFDFVPTLTSAGLRFAAWTTVLLGAFGVVLISAWWTAAAIGGHQALAAQHNEVLWLAEHRLAEATAAAQIFSTQLPLISALAADLTAQADCEVSSGCVTGSKGPGGVEDFLRQLSASASNIAQAGAAAQGRIAESKAKADACLADVRVSIGHAGDSESSETLPAGLDCFNGALAELASVNAGPQLQSALSGFTAGLVVPVSVERESQVEAVARIVDGLKVKADALAANAASLPPAGAAEPVTLHRLNAMQAVLTHASSIIPAIATAVMLDISPLILLLFRTIYAASWRHDPANAAQSRPLGEFLNMMRMAEHIRAEQSHSLPDTSRQMTAPPPRRPRS